MKKHFKGTIIITDPCYIMPEYDDEPQFSDFLPKTSTGKQFKHFTPEENESYNKYLETKAKWEETHPDYWRNDVIDIAMKRTEEGKPKSKFQIRLEKMAEEHNAKMKVDNNPISKMDEKEQKQYVWDKLMEWEKVYNPFFPNEMRYDRTSLMEFGISLHKSLMKD